MALIELKIDLKRTADALTRIADSLERIAPIPRLQSELKPAKFINVDPGAIAEAEEESDRKREAGTEGA